MTHSILAPLVSAAIAWPSFAAAPPAQPPDPTEAAECATLPARISDQLHAAREAAEEARAMEEWLHAPRSMPAYYQTDPAWAGVGYAGASIGMSGCGLTAAAMSLEWWLRERCTPADLQAAVGDSCTTSGLNDMSKFGSYAVSKGLSVSERYYDISRACDEALAGKTVWASISGYLGDSWYGGHIVLIWSQDGQLLVNDPASQGNTRTWSREELARYSWAYFYSVWLEGAI